MREMTLTPLGHVASALRDRADAPKQGDEGAPEAWLVFDAALAPALRDIAAGDDLFVFTWLHAADREVLAVRPRDDQSRPLKGVFSARSADRPNPIGLHRVTVLHVDGTRVHVNGLEAIDGTPIVDIKPVLLADRAAR